MKSKHKWKLLHSNGPLRFLHCSSRIRLILHSRHQSRLFYSGIFPSSFANKFMTDFHLDVPVDIFSAFTQSLRFLPALYQPKPRGLAGTGFQIGSSEVLTL